MTNDLRVFATSLAVHAGRPLRRRCRSRFSNSSRAATVASSSENSYSQVHQSVVLQFAFTDKCYMLRKPSRCFFMKKTAMIFALRLECRQIRLLATASLGDDSNAKTFVRRP